MKSKHENQALFEEALALREAMRLLIHSQVVNKRSETNQDNLKVISEQQGKEAKNENSASI